MSGNHIPPSRTAMKMPKPMTARRGKRSFTLERRSAEVDAAEDHGERRRLSAPMATYTPNNGPYASAIAYSKYW